MVVHGTHFDDLHYKCGRKQGNGVAKPCQDASTARFAGRYPPEKVEIISL